MTIVDENGQEFQSLLELTGLPRVDPRFFQFSDGSAGLLLEATGEYFKLNELRQAWAGGRARLAPAHADTWDGGAAPGVGALALVRTACEFDTDAAGFGKRVFIDVAGLIDFAAPF